MIRLIGLMLLIPAGVLAGEADVEAVEARQNADGTWYFSVTVRHGDEGWDHYADKWDVVAPDGTVLGERVLLHPHVNEQPFTRSQSGIVIPQEIEQVTIRAHDSVHEWGGVSSDVELSR